GEKQNCISTRLSEKLKNFNLNNLQNNIEHQGYLRLESKNEVCEIKYELLVYLNINNHQINLIKSK
ncbi:hypothetical protein, partial [Kaistella antarctica]|uniref:hypothetical protein n=1 Tax=Kaistella antarctica TaxID=266748 RepID=UPI0008BFB18A